MILVILVENIMRVLKFFLMLVCVLGAMSARAEVVLQDLQGKDIPLSSLKGKWVFINYWAGWCQPCLDEIPELNRFYAQNKKNNVAVFAVNFERLPVDEQIDMMKKFNIHYPALQQNTGRLLHFRNAGVVPVTFVLNPKGELSTTLYGGQTIESLREAMETDLNVSGDLQRR